MTLFNVYLAPVRARAQLWRTGLGLLVVVVTYLGLLACAATIMWLLIGGERSRTVVAGMAVASTPATLLMVLATFLPMIAGVALACRWLHRRGLGSVIGSGPRALRDFVRAIFVFGGVYGFGLGLFLLFDESVPNLPLGIWATLLPLTVVGLLIQTGAEEILFRGYLQQQLAARFASPVIWAVIPSVVFGFLHFDPSRLGETAPYAVAAASIFGLIAADLTARSGTLGAAWGAHFTNNFFAVALLSVDGTLTGLALRVTGYRIDEIAPSLWLGLVDLLPMIVAWLVLRRWIVTA